ncbi:hypothetical protein QTP88_008279 [Uroleucon formosanum]
MEDWRNSRYAVAGATARDVRRYRRPRALFIWRAAATSGIKTGDTHAYTAPAPHGKTQFRRRRHWGPCDPPVDRGVGQCGGQQVRGMRRRDYTDGGEPPDALEWDLDLNLELELRDDQQSRLYRYLSEGHRPRYRNEPPRRAATVTLANRVRHIQRRISRKMTQILILDC